LEMPINNNSVALAGEFAVLSQLMLRGYDANLTLGNTKAVDILAAHPATGEMFKLEVKTSRKKPQQSKMFGYTLGWPMHEKHETISDARLFYVFANFDIDNQNQFRFFIVPSSTVARYVRDQHRQWLQADPTHKDQPMRLFRLGVGEPNGYPTLTPRASDYEDKWTFESQ
jgi:hypothetical protein